MTISKNYLKFTFFYNIFRYGEGQGLLLKFYCILFWNRTVLFWNSTRFFLEMDWPFFESDKKNENNFYLTPQKNPHEFHIENN